MDDLTRERMIAQSSVFKDVPRIRRDTRRNNTPTYAMNRHITQVAMIDGTFD